MLPLFDGMMSKPAAIPGSVSWPTAGTYQLLIPEYDTFTVTLNGAGRGGQGGSGETVYGYDVQGNSGAAGVGSPGYFGSVGQNSTFGSPTPVVAAGGGNAGSSNGTITPGAGSAGGTGGTYYTPVGAVGTAGTRTVRTWARGEAGAPVPGTTITITIGSRGNGGAGGEGGSGVWDGSGYPLVGATGQTGSVGNHGSGSASWS